MNLFDTVVADAAGKYFDHKKSSSVFINVVRHILLTALLFFAVEQTIGLLQTLLFIWLVLRVLTTMLFPLLFRVYDETNARRRHLSYSQLEVLTDRNFLYSDPVGADTRAL